MDKRGLTEDRNSPETCSSIDLAENNGSRNPAPENSVPNTMDGNTPSASFKPVRQERPRSLPKPVAHSAPYAIKPRAVKSAGPKVVRSVPRIQVMVAYNDPSQVLQPLRVPEDEFNRVTAAKQKTEEEDAPITPVIKIDMNEQPDEVKRHKEAEKNRTEALEDHLGMPSGVMDLVNEDDNQQLTEEEVKETLELKTNVINQMRNANEGITSSIAVPEDVVPRSSKENNKWDVANFKEICKEHIPEEHWKSTSSRRNSRRKSKHSIYSPINQSARQSPFHTSRQESKHGFSSPKNEAARQSPAHSSRNNSVLFHRFQSDIGEEVKEDQGKKKGLSLDDESRSKSESSLSKKIGVASQGSLNARSRSATNQILRVESQTKTNNTEQKGMTADSYFHSQKETPQNDPFRSSEPPRPQRSYLRKQLTLHLRDVAKRYKRQQSEPFEFQRHSKLKRRRSLNLRNIFSKRIHTEDGTHFENKLQTKTMCLLLLLGSLASVVESGLNKLVKEIQTLNTEVRSYVSGYGASLGVFVAFALGTAAVSAFVTHRFDPIVSPGGGIPVMKYIIGSNSVAPLAYWLNLRSLVVKFFGLAFAASCPGLSVGREGPFVHMASIIANQLMLRVDYFHDIHNSSSLRTQVFSSACAVGVASAFTAPIGGVLFSIEVTRTYYLLANYWKAFAAAIAGFVLIRLIDIASVGTVKATVSFFDLIDDDGTGVYQDSDYFETTQIPFIAILASFMGLLGPLYIKCKMRSKKFLGKFVNPHPQISIWLIVAIQACIFYASGAFFRVSMGQSIIDLLKYDTLPEERWGSGTYLVLINIFIYFAVRVVLTAISVSIPLPVGDFMPIFAAGAAFGRFFAMLVQLIFPSLRVMPSVYAVCGAAAFVGSTTQTFSTAVITLEFTWLFQFQMQILISVFISVTLSMQFSVSIYEAAMQARGMVHLTPLRKEKEFRLKAKDIMVTKPDLCFLPTKTKYFNIILLLKNSQHQAYPVVNNEQEMIFLGCVARHQLKQHLYKYFKLNECLQRLMKELPGEFDEFSDHHKSRLDLKSKFQYHQNLGILKTKAEASSRNLKKLKRAFSTEDPNTHKGDPSPSPNRINALRKKLMPLVAKKAIPKMAAPVDQCLEDKSLLRYPQLLEIEFDLQEAPEVTVDPSAFTIPEFMSAEQIYVLFEMLRCKRVFIASFYGALVGVISPPIFSDAVKSCSKEN